MLKVPAAPALITHYMIDKRRGGLFKAACQSRQEPDPPACPAEQPRLDKIMAQDQPVAFELWQPCSLRKGPGPDDRVVTPVIAFRL